MIIRCPTCNFSGKLTDRSRQTGDTQPLCPRCHALMPLPGLKEAAVGSDDQDELAHQHPQGVPWEMRSSWLDLAAFWRTSASILFHPSATFTALKYNSGIRSSLIFALVYGSFGHLLGRYWFILLGIHYGILEDGAISNTLRFTGVILSAPILFLIFIFFTAGLVHFFLLLLFAAKRPFSATVQVVAYGSGAASLLNVVPVLGSFLAPVWALVVWCIGLAKAHQTSKVRTYLAILLPFVFISLLVVATILVIAALGIVELLDIIQLQV